ncbi:hypothetical protein O3V59_16365 [Brevibacillus thermoruber]|uniref:Uncharacterized protein n=1 Tax=Brevibacillus thermoruber TaxID=33942 RepID=A0A9X3TSD7_9BACL|nr:hypothetical protein [Brevibacillus thermoruber]MDA5109941.1 hypothetical protein [Brevibacillus thermoruber]
MRTPKIIIGIILIIVGLLMVNEAKTLKEKTEDTVSTVFEPISSLSITSNSFDPEKYRKEAMTKVGNWGISAIRFESKMTSGSLTIFTGIFLIVTAGI